MRRILVIGLGLLAAALLNPGAASAQQLPRPLLSVQSSSGQFVAIRKDGPRSDPKILALSTNHSFLRLEPGTLAVSAERIKQALWKELQIPGPWKGRVHLSIRSTLSTNEPVLFGSEKLNEGWRYGLEFPEVVDRERFVRAITQSVLLEYANRGAPPRSAELPTWLLEGFSRHLLASRETELIVSAPQLGDELNPVAAIPVMQLRQDPMRTLRTNLALAGQGLTFQQLSWPAEEQLTGIAGEVYRSTAQLLVNELARLPDGRARLRRLLQELPRFYNWQLAFLRAFEGVFQRPLDVEKWWELELAHFTGRDAAQTWEPVESWYKLDEVLGAPAEVRMARNDLPQNTRVTLQFIIRDWQAADQLAVLGTKLVQLQSLRIRISPDLAPLVDAYRQALEEYMARRDNLHGGLFTSSAARLRRLSEDTVKVLDSLDQRREILRPAMK